MGLGFETRRLGWAGSLGCWIKQLKTTTAYGLNAADFWAYRLTNDTSDTADNNNDTRSICASIIATRWATIRACTRGVQAERGRGSFCRVIYDNICSVNVAGRHVDRCLSQHRTSHIAWLGGSLRTDGSMLTAYISVGSNSPSPNPSSSLSTIVISRGSSSSSGSGSALSRLERHIWHRQHSASPKAQLWPPFCSQPVSIIARLLHFN